MLRVSIVIDVGVSPWPAATYLDDGQVIMPGEVGQLLVRWLTPAGLAAVLSRVAASGLVDRERRFIALLPNRGVTTYAIERTRADGSTIRVTADVNSSPGGDAARFTALLDDLADPVRTLPVSAWSDVRGSAYVPATTRVRVTIIDNATVSTTRPDIARVRWPLATSWDALGQVLWSDAGTTVRCVVLARADVERLRDALAAAGAHSDRDWIASTNLRSGRVREIAFDFVAQLPDETPGCSFVPGANWSLGDAQVAYVVGSSRPFVRLLDTGGTDTALTAGEAIAWSPDGTALLSVRPGTATIRDAWIRDMTTGTERLLLTDVVGGAWSPSGDSLAVNRSPIDLGDAWVVGRDGRGLRRLADGDNAAWSPDGARIAVVVEQSGRPVVAVVDVASGAVHLLSPGTHPTWTSESSPRIAFADWGSARVLLVEPETGSVEQAAVVRDPIEWLGRVRVPSPPGWALGVVAGGRALLIDRPGSEPRSLDAGGMVLGGLSSSPDGTWVAAVVAGRTTGLVAQVRAAGWITQSARNDTGAGGGGDLVVMRTDGDGWFQLTERGNVREVAWRPLAEGAAYGVRVSVAVYFLQATPLTSKK